MSYKITIWFKIFLKMYSTILEGKKGHFPHWGSKNKAFREERPWILSVLGHLLFTSLSLPLIVLFRSRILSISSLHISIRPLRHPHFFLIILKNFSLD